MQPLHEADDNKGFPSPGPDYPPMKLGAKDKPTDKPANKTNEGLQRLLKATDRIHATDRSTMTHEEIDALKAKHLELMELVITKGDEQNVILAALLQQVRQIFVEVKEVALTMGRCEQFNKSCKDMIAKVKIDEQARADQDAKIRKQAADILQKTMNQFMNDMNAVEG